MAEKRKNRKNVRTSDFLKDVLKLAAKDLQKSEVQIVNDLVLKNFPEFVLQVKRERIGK